MATDRDRMEVPEAANHAAARVIGYWLRVRRDQGLRGEALTGTPNSIADEALEAALPTLYEQIEERPRLTGEQETAVFDAAETLEGIDRWIGKPSFERIAQLLRSIVDDEVAAALHQAKGDVVQQKDLDREASSWQCQGRGGPWNRPRAVEPTDKPRTKTEALEMALKWGSEWSHWNEHAAQVDDSLPGDRRLAWVHTAQHDAAEVQRLAALHSMLPEGPVSQDKEITLGEGER